MRDCFVKLNKMPPILQISEKYLKINEELRRSEIENKKNIHSDHDDHDEEEGTQSEDEEIDVETVAEDQDTIDDEPVSPPPCNPEEAPTLLLSKTIEEIAVEVVDENRSQISVSPLLKEDEIPKTVSKPSSSSSGGPSLIPLTVSEIDTETESKLSSQSLHMSGGGVYTTDSFYYSQNLLSPPSPRDSNTRTRSSVIKRNPSPGVNRVKKKQEETKTELDTLLDSYQTAAAPPKQTAICRIPQATIKLSDSLEITPIRILPLPISEPPVVDRVNKVSHSERGHKRKHESDVIATKTSRLNELVIEKIPRTCNEETDLGMVSRIISEKRDDEALSLNCKLLISKKNIKKYELVFENGQSLLLNRNIFKSLDISGKSQTIRRKKVKPRKQKNPSKTAATEPIPTSASNVDNEEKSEKSKVTNENNNDCQLPKKGVTKASEIATPAKKKCMNKEREPSGTISAEIQLQNPLIISKIPETLGLHKLPSIVSQPPFLKRLKQKSESQKSR